MNHRDDIWPPEVQEFAPALQRHDKGLLRRQLTQINSRSMQTLPGALLFLLVCWAVYMEVSITTSDVLSGALQRGC